MALNSHCQFVFPTGLNIQHPQQCRRLSISLNPLLALGIIIITSKVIKRNEVSHFNFNLHLLSPPMGLILVVSL